MYNNDSLLVAKIGGNVIENPQMLDEFIESFSKIKQPKIIIHGGGKSATQLAKKLDIETRMIEGRRVTSKAMIDIVTMTYSGKINKTIVAKLQAKGVNALGLSGADANCIEAVKRPSQPVDYGYVGDITSVNGKQIYQFLDMGITPVFCALSHDKNGQLLNTNADTIASNIARRMTGFFRSTELFYCFELKGVLRDIKDKDSVIENINYSEYNLLKQEGIITDGMLPKLQNCFEALKDNVSRIHIANLEFLKNQQTLHTTLTL